MVSETSRRFPRVRQGNGRGRGRRRVFGKILFELASAILVARVFGAHEKFLTLCELEIFK